MRHWLRTEIDATVFDYETAKALNDVALRLGKVDFLPYQG